MRFVAFDRGGQIARINPATVFGVIAEPENENMGGATTWSVVIESVNGAAVVVRSGLDRVDAAKVVAEIERKLCGEPAA